MVVTVNTNSWRTRALAASWCVALGVFVMLAADNAGIAQQAPQRVSPQRQPAPGGQAPAQPAPGRQGAAPQGQGRGRGPAPVDTLGAGPWDFPAGRGARIHVSVVTKGLNHPWGIAFLPDGGMLVTERPGRLRQIKNGVLDPTPIGPLPEMLATGLGGLLDVSLHPQLRAEPADLSHLLEAGPEGSRRCDDGGTAREVGWRLDAHRGQRHPRRRCVSRWTGIAAGPRPGERQLRLAPGVGQSRLPLRLARRSQLSARVAGPGLAHRQDPAHPRRRQRAGGQSVRQQAGIQARDLFARPSQSARARRFIR